MLTKINSECIHWIELDLLLRTATEPNNRTTLTTKINNPRKNTSVGRPKRMDRAVRSVTMVEKRRAKIATGILDIPMCSNAPVDRDSQNIPTPSSSAAIGKTHAGSQVLKNAPAMTITDTLRIKSP
ncbi:MAG: hypothetical protein KDC99_01105 [Cyclobacteriaceae bacterium]|nr:hypothetical protein [Cyclobacteriaceae bacterium]